MALVTRLTGLEILDSRGRPTVLATCALASGAAASASVPAGASTGSAEAIELRDGDMSRYGGLGCRAAARLIGDEIASALVGSDIATQRSLDELLIALDGTPNKRRLGANTILAVSLAFARALSIEQSIPLYRLFAQIAGAQPHQIPRPTINLFSGGKHAGGQVSIQDLLLVPASAATIDDALAMTYAVYQEAARLVYRKYGMRALTADEGGLAPEFPATEAMIEDAIEAISAAGLAPGRAVALAMDVAATHMHRSGRYHLDGRSLESAEMIALVSEWLRSYPIISVEDALAENDWEHWPLLRQRIAGRALVLGDDLLCTNPARIQRAATIGAADALLLKVNQIGTISEALDAFRLARSAGWSVTASARSGETEDNWLADLAVGWQSDYIKIGSITQSERLAKYNRLLSIAAETGLPLAPLRPTLPPFASPQGR
jgi:enolase